MPDDNTPESIREQQFEERQRRLKESFRCAVCGMRGGEHKDGCPEDPGEQPEEEGGEE